MTTQAWKNSQRADVRQIEIARAFGFDGLFRLEAELKLPAVAPKPVPGMPMPKANA
jgi:hypothetical protein